MKTIHELTDLKDYAGNPKALDWSAISSQEFLSEDFMRKYKDQLDWPMISYWQPLRKEFIKEMRHYINWTCLAEGQPVSKDFIEKMKDCLNHENKRKDE